MIIINKYRKRGITSRKGDVYSPKQLLLVLWCRRIKVGVQKKARYQMWCSDRTSRFHILGRQKVPFNGAPKQNNTVQRPGRSWFQGCSLILLFHSWTFIVWETVLGTLYIRDLIYSSQLHSEVGFPHFVYEEMEG